MIKSERVPRALPIRRLVAILTAALALALVGTTIPAASAASVSWDDPLTTKVEKRPKVKISKSEYRRIIRGQSYRRVKQIADGKGAYFGQCVEGGPCGPAVRWYMWRYRGGKVKYDGKWYGRYVMIGFKNGKVAKKFHN